MGYFTVHSPGAGAGQTFLQIQGQIGAWQVEQAASLGDVLGLIQKAAQHEAHLPFLTQVGQCNQGVDP